MNTAPPANAAVFRRLCRVLGGQDSAALHDCIAASLLQPLFDMAQRQDLLPALAVRCNEQQIDLADLYVEIGDIESDRLMQSLMDNTRRNMQISAQALKLTRQLNRAGITPLFLKGTARLLTAGADNLGFRQQVDIDLLVPAGEIAAAGDVLLADGYRYCEFSSRPGVAPRELGDTASAIKLSAAHHHLPPLVKPDYAATVELHRHFLDSRFQRDNPLAPLFSSAVHYASHDAKFCVPSTDYQIIHLILGKFVNDGHLARRTFPIREACDLMALLDDARGNIDQALVTQHCGRTFALYCALLRELMGYKLRGHTLQSTVSGAGNSSRYMHLLLKRFDSQATRTMLDAYARADYLAHALAYSPAKLPAYLQRVFAPD